MFWNFSFIDFGKLIISHIENVILQVIHTVKFKAKYLIIFFPKFIANLMPDFLSNSSQINHCVFKSLLDFTKHCYIVCTEILFRQVHFEHVVSHTKEK